MATRSGDAETGSDPVASCDEVMRLLTRLVGLRIVLGALSAFFGFGRRGIRDLLVSIVFPGAACGARLRTCALCARVRLN